MLRDQHRLPTLVYHFQSFDNNAVCRTLHILAHLLDRRAHVNRIVQEDWPDEAQTVVSVTHRARIDLTCSHAHSYAEHQGAVRHPLPERLRPAPLRIHVVRIEVARLPGVQHDVGLGNCPAYRLSPRACDKVFEKHLGCHESLRSRCYSDLRNSRSITSQANVSSQSNIADVNYHDRGNGRANRNYLEPHARLPSDGCHR